MDLQFIISAGIILILGSILQGAAGFGFGMFAIPLLMLIGQQPYEAIVLLSICGTAQTFTGACTLRKHIDWPMMIRLIIISAAALPFGVWALEAITFLDRDVIRQIFGGLILTVLIIQWVWRIKPQEYLHWAWSILAVVLCGFMAGLSGMGGPPVVMWVMAHRWSNEKSRATLWTLFTGLTPVQLFFHYQRFGEPVLTAIENGALLIPITFLGIIPGLWLGRKIPKPILRRISYIILLIISLYAIGQPLFT